MRGSALYFAWLIALIGFCASIFYAEILKHPPCPLCWYQRIALFPLVILLGIAAYRGEKVIIPYVLPIVCFGGIVALFQLFRPLIPFLQNVKICTIGVSCTGVGFSFFGLALFPMVSAVGFCCIAILLMIARK